jgi:hypothetical protein
MRVYSAQIAEYLRSEKYFEPKLYRKKTSYVKRILHFEFYGLEIIEGKELEAHVRGLYIENLNTFS